MVFNIDDLKHALIQIQADIRSQINQMPLEVSGAKVQGIEYIHIHYDKYNPTRGGS